jgi:hypothetical protein
MKQMSAKDFVDSNVWLYSLIKSPESERKTGQFEIQVFRKPIVLKPVASQGRATFEGQYLTQRLTGQAGQDQSDQGRLVCG